MSPNNHQELIRNGFLRLNDIAPALVISLPYASADNVCGKALYPNDPQPYMVRDAANALAEAGQTFLRHGYSLLIWDAYRPFSVQQLLFEHIPDERYIAKPVKSGGQLIQGSKHSRGSAVDLTLIEKENNKPLTMPTGFDDFTDKAHRDCYELSNEAIENREFLNEIMSEHGFIGLPTEWWHFDWHEWHKYPLLDIPLD